MLLICFSTFFLLVAFERQFVSEKAKPQGFCEIDMQWIKTYYNLCAKNSKWLKK